MGINSLTYNIDQGAGTQTSDFKQYQNTASLVFVADSNDPANDTVYTMKMDSAAPKVGYLHPYIPWMRAIRVECRRVSPILYEYHVDYQSRGQPGQSPLDEPPKIKWGFSVSEENTDVDGDGNPMIMITGQDFNPPLREQFYDQKVTVTRNVKFIDTGMWSQYAGAVSSDDFECSDPQISAPAGTCKITEPAEGELAGLLDDDSEYYTVTMGITIRRVLNDAFDESKVWWHRVLAKDYWYKQPDFIIPSNPDHLWKNKDSEGNPALCLHDTTTGYRLPYDPVTGRQDPTQAQWYEFPPKKLLPFAVLNITN
jgi:hypothetical protein